MSVAAEVLTKVLVEIQGLPPGLLFQGKGLMEAKDKSAPGPKPPSGDHDKEAELLAHWCEVGKGKSKKRQLCIPGRMIVNSIIQAGADFQDPKNKRRSMGSLLGATVSIEPMDIPLGTAEFETYVDWVRIPPRTGAMVKIGRPLIREWRAAFTLLVDEETWRAEVLEGIVKYAGKRVGIGAWRPGLKGPYGKFVLVKFAIQR